MYVTVMGQYSIAKTPNLEGQVLQLVSPFTQSLPSKVEPTRD